MQHELDSKLIFSEIGFEFEFFSNYTLTDTATLLSKVLGKRVLPYYKKDGQILVPDQNTFQLIRDISGGKKLLELITGPLPYYESLNILEKVLNWISNNGSTNEYCAFQPNISFNSKYTNVRVQKLNILKFILEFDEDFVYSRFPNRIGNLYAKSIKNIYPLNKLTFNSNNKFDGRYYDLPIGKWYGFNFKKLENNYIECRYLGGIEYEKKYKELLEIINYTIVKLYDCIITNEFSEEIERELDRIIGEHKVQIKAYQKFSEFKKNFKDIELFVDLTSNEKIINSYYFKIRDSLFEILNKGDLKKGKINYDSDRSKLQLNGCILENNGFISNVDMIDCELTGIIENCELHNCKVTDAHIRESDLYSCKIKNSRVRNCESDIETEFEGSYLFGEKSIHGAKIKGGFFVSGSVTKFAKMSDVEIFNINKIE